MTYRIVRHYAPHLRRRAEVRATGLTLEEAQAHCADPSTREPDAWFDGYEAEGGSLVSRPAVSLGRALEAIYPDRNERGTR